MKALQLHWFLHLRVDKNLDPTWQALVDLGIKPRDLIDFGIGLLAYSVSNRIKPFGELVAFHKLNLDSEKLVFALRDLSSREINHLHNRMTNALSESSSGASGGGVHDERLKFDREQLQLASCRAMVRFYFWTFRNTLQACLIYYNECKYLFWYFKTEWSRKRR